MNTKNFLDDSKKGGEHVLEIMKKDLKSTIKNPIVMVVLLAIIIIPSLYALVNIYACWNPYENTDNIQFAIANEDNGSTYEGERFNVGNDLETMLENDTNFDWVFVSSDELRRGVQNGTYYAGIIVPTNFTESVLSVTSDNPHSGELEYVVNQKYPVASKLTDSAAKSVYNKINAEIVMFINLAAYDKLGDLQSSLASGAIQMSSGAVQLTGGASQVSAGAGAVSSGASQVSAGASQLSSGAGAVSSGANQVSSGASQLSSGANRVSTGASQVSTGASQVSSGASAVSSGASELSAGANQVSGGASQISQNVKQQSGGQKSQLSDSLDNLASGASQVADKSNELSAGASQVSTGANQVSSGASEVSSGANSLSEGANSLASGASQVANGADSLASGANSLAGGVNELADGSLSLAAGAELLANSAASALMTASSSLYLASDSLSDVTGVDEDQLGDYIYSPVKLEKHELYPISNYASQVAPFYIVLSMWVGALITCVMLKTGSSYGTKYKPHEVYMGKLMLFNIMAVLQSIITIIGCYIIGIDIYDNIMFIFSCIFVSLIFMVITYSLISLLGQVGKGISILLLVFQISGTGGIYPIDIMSDFFRIIYPYLPMTHAINIVREATIGLRWANYLPSFAVLLIIGVLFVILSLILKQRFDARTHYFEEKLEESNLFG